jgi:citrate synthase
MKSGLEGVIAADTAIARIDGERGELEFRGYPIEELVAHSGFEDSAYLLWYGELPSPTESARLRAELAAQRPALASDATAAMKLLPPEAHPLEALRFAVTFLAASDPDRADFSVESLMSQARRLTSVMPALVGAFEQLRNGREPIAPLPSDNTAEALLRGLGIKFSPAILRAIDADLVIYAEHEFNASTFTARVVAATEADMYSAIVSGLCALRGPKHGGANDDVAELFDLIGTPEKVDEVIGAKILRYQSLGSAGRKASSERFPGFGHRVWKVDDPRAAALRELAAAVCQEAGRSDLIEIAERVRALVQRELKLVVNVDYYSAAMYMALGIPRDLCTAIFAVARTAGWTAHVIEQLGDNRLIRPRSNYIGAPTRHVPTRKTSNRRVAREAARASAHQ